MLSLKDEDGRFVPTYKNVRSSCCALRCATNRLSNGVINNLSFLWDVEFYTWIDYPYLKLDVVKDITAILYPDDTTIEGKELRLVQEYFMTSAGLQTIINIPQDGLQAQR